MYPDEFNNQHPTRQTEIISRGNPAILSENGPLAAGELGGAFSWNDTDERADTALTIRFYNEMIRDEKATAKSGMLVAHNKEMCEIRMPGSRDILKYEVTQDWLNTKSKHFHRLYRAFKDNVDQDAVSGLPLKMWPPMSMDPTALEQAAYMGIRTVEQLAQTQDTGIQKLGAGWQSWRTRAKDYLENAKSGKIVNQLRTELEERDRRISTLENMLKEQGKTIEAVRQGFTPPPPTQTLDIQAEVAKAVAAALGNLQPRQEAPKDPPKRRGRPPKAKPPTEPEGTPEG